MNDVRDALEVDLIALWLIRESIMMDFLEVVCKGMNLTEKMNEIESAKD